MSTAEIDLYLIGVSGSGGIAEVLSLVPANRDYTRLRATVAKLSPVTIQGVSGVGDTFATSASRPEPRGYGDFLEVIADPKHERHAESMEWIGEPFDPHAVDTEGHAQALAALAKQWARKPSARRKKKT